MKTNNIPASNIICFILSLLTIIVYTSCDNTDPVKEDTPELITMVELTFSPAGGGDKVIVTATDPDGEGIADITVDKAIVLATGKTYALSIALVNGLADPASSAYNITAEVSQESAEHMLFFGWTGNAFSDPAGNGNIDNRSDKVNYEDADLNGLPLGLETLWTTADTPSSGTFRVLLKHQPALKSVTSTSSDGESDLDVQFEIEIQ
jgi:hypothetical protein